MEPIVTKEFEKMDFKKIKEKYLKLHPDVNPQASLYGYNYDEKFDDKIINYDFYETKIGGIQSGTELTYYNNSPFMIIREFYSNGNIKQKGLYIIKGDYYKGIWYYYNEKGDLTNSIDYDTYFKFSWEDVALFMNENSIEINLGKPKSENIFVEIRNNSYRMSPASFDSNYGKDPSEFLWTITWKQRNRPSNEYTEISLDGITGKMGYRKKYTVAEEPGDEGTETIEYFNLPKDKK